MTVRMAGAWAASVIIVCFSFRLRTKWVCLGAAAGAAAGRRGIFFDIGIMECFVRSARAPTAVDGYLNVM